MVRVVVPVNRFQRLGGQAEETDGIGQRRAPLHGPCNRGMAKGVRRHVRKPSGPHRPYPSGLYVADPRTCFRHDMPIPGLRPAPQVA